jgi:hypothetical protein
MKNFFDLSGHVAIITGGASFFGPKHAVEINPKNLTVGGSE